MEIGYKSGEVTIERDDQWVLVKFTARTYACKDPVAVEKKLEDRGWEMIACGMGFVCYSKGEWTATIDYDDDPTFSMDQPMINFCHNFYKGE